MKLIGSLTSPYVRKVRVVLAEKKLEYQFELNDVWSPDTNMQQFNPLGKVPCLVMEDGGALYDSRVIVEYMDALSPFNRLIPPSGRERAVVRCWEALADGMLDAAVAVFKERQRPPEQVSQDWIDRQLGKIEAGLQSMSQGLADQAYCRGNAVSLADLATGCALAYLGFRFPEIAWREPYPNLAALHDKMAARPSFIDTQPPAN